MVTIFHKAVELMEHSTCSYSTVPKKAEILNTIIFIVPKVEGHNKKWLFAKIVIRAKHTHTVTFIINFHVCVMVKYNEIHNPMYYGK